MPELRGHLMGAQQSLAPPLPTLRELATELREIHEAFMHPEAGSAHVGLTFDRYGWRVTADPSEPWYGREFVPGFYVSNFNAIGAARRLLAAARDDFPGDLR